MKVQRGIKGLEGKFSSAAIALGNFDGVHLGHRKIIEHLKGRAIDIECESVVFTFEPHPAKILRPDVSPKLITSLDKKLGLFEECGVDGVVLADFNRKFASQHPESFITEILVDKLGARLVVVGHDFTFGKGKEGTIDSLKALGEKKGFLVEVIDPVMIKGEVISSTMIRELIKSGEVKQVKDFLGRYYSIDGIVVKGHNRGKSLGFPTANLDTCGELIPKNGVYAVRVRLGRKEMGGVANIGTKPTFDDKDTSIEVHIFDFSDSIYGDGVDMFFIDRIRDEVRFDTKEELSKQICEDIISAKSLLKKGKL